MHRPESEGDSQQAAEELHKKKKKQVAAVVQKLLLAYIWQLLDFYRMTCRKSCRQIAQQQQNPWLQTSSFQGLNIQTKYFSSFFY